jgi:hypothetical protein
MNQKLTPSHLAFLKNLHSGKKKSNDALIYDFLKNKGATSSYHLEGFFEKNRIVKTNGKSTLNSVSSTLRSLELKGYIRKCGQTRIMKTLYSIYEAVLEQPQMLIEANKIKVEQKNTWLNKGLKHGYLTDEKILELQAQEIVPFT